MTITYALIQMLEKISENSDRARIITKAHVNKLLVEKGNCIGCTYVKGGATFKEFGPVILASGGFGADFSQDSLLAKYRPDLLHLPTTNGEHCTGDGIKMGEAVGAKTIDLEWVQVHPTGLVKPDDADAKIKFLAAEALRGVGGLVLDKDGKRFANELGRRDYVTGEMWKNKPPFRLVLNKAASDEIIWHCKHYTGRGVMKYFESGKALAEEMKIPVETLIKTHQDHYEAAKKTEKDPDGGSWPAYPSGKSWDEASGKTGSGKKFYHNIIDGSQVATQQFYVAIITPVIHYTMGGLEIAEDATVLDTKGKRIEGLYAAGEVAGGVHGNNRLGGNSLLDCVVFGRVAGVAACKWALGKDMHHVDLATISGGGLTGEVKSSKLSGGSYEDTMNKADGAKPAAKKEKKEKKASGGGGGFTMADVAKHNTAKDCWVVLHNNVLDVTKFLKQHPGGELAITTFAGKDATAEFDMIHPPGVVEKYFPEGIIGQLGGGGGAAEEDDDDDDEEEEAGGGGAGYSMDEVSKHNKKSDCWVVLSGKVLDVTKFLSQHPGGELAILTFAGKDATAEFDMIHPPGVVEKYFPEGIIGELGGGGAKKAKKAKKGAAAAISMHKDTGDSLANHQAWGDYEKSSSNWRDDALDTNPGVLIVNIQAYIASLWYLGIAILWECGATIFSAQNIKISNDRKGLTRSAIFLILFIVIHAVGNLHVFEGPDDFNGYGYFYVRLYWTGFGIPANIVEEYIILCAMLHVFVGLKRTYDMKLSMGIGSGQLNLAISGLMLLTFMTIHLWQFRFGDTGIFGPYLLRPPPYLINFWGILSLNLFWTDDTDVQPVGVRDIYALEFRLFKNPVWAAFYIVSVGVFMAHACIGWKKVVPALGIPKLHHDWVNIYGYIIFVVLGAIYTSFVVFCVMTDPAGPAKLGVAQVPLGKIEE